MKKMILALCLCAVFAVSGCGKNSPAESKNSSAADSSSQTAVGAMAEIEESSADETPKETYVNSSVEKVAEEKKPEDFDIDGNYSFYYDGFDKVYSNAELKKAFDKIEKICDEANFSLSFSYENMDSDVIVSHNTYTSYLTCSTIKAPYIKWILSQDPDLDEVIVRDTCWEGDDGRVASEAYGTKHTVKELIKYAIQESDNTAYYLLYRRFGYVGFNDLMYSLGANYYLGNSWIFTYCNVLDMAKCYKDIYEYGENSKNGKWLTELMQKTDVETQITQALGGKYKVSHKYGSEFNESNFHDCAIVYADSPFVLCIFTDQKPETEESCKVFRELARAFDDVNNLLVTD